MHQEENFISFPSATRALFALIVIAPNLALTAQMADDVLP